MFLCGSTFLRGTKTFRGSNIFHLRHFLFYMGLEFFCVGQIFFGVGWSKVLPIKISVDAFTTISELLIKFAQEMS